jgi:hypothetical protein
MVAKCYCSGCPPSPGHDSFVRLEMKIRRFKWKVAEYETEVYTDMIAKLKKEDDR